MTFTLSSEALAAGYRLEAFATIGSTSAEAMARAREGVSGPIWVVSGHQSAGRGRRGSAWETASGNLAASLLLRTDLPPAAVATLGFVAGLALVRALDGCCANDQAPLPSPLAGEGVLRDSEGRMRGRATNDPSSVVASRRHLFPQGEKETPRFTLKWPNDVLADGAKLAGILLETEQLEQGRAVVIGIGVNVAHAPVGLAYRTTSLGDLGIDVPAERLFRHLSAAWIGAHRTWDRGRGFDAIRDAWLARAAGLGGPVAIKAADAVREGTFDTIDEHGQLVLTTAEGTTRRISAGEVHFGAAATLRAGAQT